MKYLLYLLSLIVILSMPCRSFAAFPARSAGATAPVSNRHAGRSVIPHFPVFDMKRAGVKRILPEPADTGDGWVGIAALVCGVLSLIPPFLSLFAIPAIILGAIGMGHGHANRVSALVGFVLGILGVVIFITLVLVLAIIIGTSL